MPIVVRLTQIRSTFRAAKLRKCMLAKVDHKKKVLTDTTMMMDPMVTYSLSVCLVFLKMVILKNYHDEGNDWKLRKFHFSRKLMLFTCCQFFTCWLFPFIVWLIFKAIMFAHKLRSSRILNGNPCSPTSQQKLSSIMLC